MAGSNRQTGKSAECTLGALGKTIAATAIVITRSRLDLRFASVPDYGGSRTLVPDPIYHNRDCLHCSLQSDRTLPALPLPEHKKGRSLRASRERLFTEQGPENINFPFNPSADENDILPKARNC
jgi:hypothetical protein